MSIKKRCISIGLTLCVAFSTFTLFPAVARAAPNYYSADQVTAVTDRIIVWKKTAFGLSGGQSLLDDGVAAVSAGSYDDWYAVGTKRLPGYSEESAGYLTALETATIANTASKTATLTDLYRNILSILATGGDPTRIRNGSGESNLVADYVYNRGRTASLGAQGITGWIWGLIVLDSMQYTIPSGSFYSRDDLIVEMLKQQRSTGGFALSGRLPDDADITAMAVQALSPYYNSEKTYTCLRASDQTTQTKTVRQAVDEALAKLSAMQSPAGDYESVWGTAHTRTAETAAQVAVALCCLGIDPQKDPRFIKNGATLLDGILLYQMPDGGFAHTLPATASNSITTGQILYSMSAILRQMQGLRKLYDFRPEPAASVKTATARLIGDIASITSSTGKSRLEDLLRSYQSLMDSERMYVYNYTILADALRSAGTPVSGSSAVTGSASKSTSGSASGASVSISSSAAGSTVSATSDPSGSGFETPSGDPVQSISEKDPSDGQGKSETPDKAEKTGRFPASLVVILAIAVILLLLIGWPKWKQYQQRRHEDSKDKGNGKTDH